MRHASADPHQILGRAAQALADAGQPLEQALRACLRACLPAMADFGCIDLDVGHGPLRVVAAHQSPAAETALQSARWSRPDPVLGVCAVAAGGPVHRGALTQADRDRLLQSEAAQVRALATAGVQALLSVPLPLGRRIVGALTLGTGRSGRRFGPRRRELAARLACLMAARVASEQAEQTLRVREELMGRLGHELRNPLAPIQTALELIERRHPDLLVAERRLIGRQVAHLAALVDDLLDISRLDRGSLGLQRRPVDLRGVLAQAVERTAPCFAANPLRLAQPDVPVWVDGDPDRLAQAVGKLLLNAARFAPAGTVWLRLLRQEAQAHIEVEDNGCGMPPELLSRLFEAFVQGPQAIDRELGGLGLGLAIVRGLVHLHGGSVTASSPGVGQGARFRIALPLLAAPEPPALAAAGGGAPVGLRILVVDDNRDAADMLATLLDLAGHQARTAGDAEQALDELSAFEPELALLDIGLPRVDGYALARLIRERLGQRRLPLVALTGYGSSGDRGLALAAGFDEHLVKPVTIDHLLEVIARLTGGPSPGTVPKLMPQVLAPRWASPCAQAQALDQAHWKL